MRIIIFFDLPVDTAKDRKYYRNFVSLLKKEGFIMMQKSVYIKLSINTANVNKTLDIIKGNIPPNGDISSLVITEKQFAEIEILLGEFKTDVINDERRVIEI